MDGRTTNTKENIMSYKSYIGAKIIQAEQMDECTFLKRQGKDVSGRETRPGYMVMYPTNKEGEDNYVSWSPKEVFEIAYRELTKGEKQLVW